jgi:hypothetical protein
MSAVGPESKWALTAGISAVEINLVGRSVVSGKRRATAAYVPFAALYSSGSFRINSARLG